MVIKDLTRCASFLSQFAPPDSARSIRSVRRLSSLFFTKCEDFNPWWVQGLRGAFESFPVPELQQVREVRVYSCERGDGMVDHAVKPRRMTQEQHEKINALLGAEKMTCAAIADQVGCHQATVGRIKASLALRTSTHKDLADPETLDNFKVTLTDVTFETLQSMRLPKQIKPADRWSLMRVVSEGVKVHRLLSDQSTANVAHRSLAGMVSRRAGSLEAPEAPKPDVPKDTAAAVDAKVLDAVVEPVASVVPEPLV